MNQNQPNPSQPNQSRTQNRAKGLDGEELAVAHLITHGFDIIERNYSFKTNFHGGEIDIIARRGSVVHFIEVKSRSTDAFGCGREAVTYLKQKTIRRMATAWLCKNKLYDKIDIAFDIIEITNREIELFENCF